MSYMLRVVVINVKVFEFADVIDVKVAELALQKVDMQKF